MSRERKAKKKKKKKRLRSFSRLKGTKATWLLNAMHKPGLSPGLGKNNYRKQYWNNWCYLNMDCELDNCSVAQSCLTLCNPMGCSTPVFPVPHHLLEFAQVHIHCISDAIQLSHPLAPSSPSALNLSQHQGHLPWVLCLHQTTKYLAWLLFHFSDLSFL